MCFSYDAGCHVILYVTLTANNTFTDWWLIFSYFFLCWPFNSLELFSSSSQWLVCYPVDHSCTTPSIRVAIIWFSFSVISTKIESCWFSLLCQNKTGTEVLRIVCFLVLLCLSTLALVFVLHRTARLLSDSGQCSNSNRCLTMLKVQ